jgi:XapX domain-containing protein
MDVETFVVEPVVVEGSIMSELFWAALAGFLVGLIFSAIRLPIPAPPVLSGVAGIVGIYLGSQAYQWIVESYFQRP